MTRLPFTHLMLAQIMADAKRTTRRMKTRFLPPGQIMLASCNFPRPAKHAVCPSRMHGIHGLLESELFKARQAYLDCQQHVPLPQLPGWKLAPSIHMPEWLCMQALVVVGTYQQAVWDISDMQAREEGFRSKDEFIEYFTTLHPGLPLSTMVQAIDFLPISWADAVQHPSFDMTFRPQPDWHEDWREYIPEWQRPLRVIMQHKEETWTN